MHVLVLPSWYISSYSEYSGIFFKEQSELLLKHKSISKVTVVAFNFIKIKSIIERKKLDLGYSFKKINGVYTHTLNIIYIPFFSDLYKQMLSKKILSNIINKEKIDITHVHSFFNGNIALWIKEKYKIPFVVTEHTSMFARNKLSNKSLCLAQKVFKSSNINISVSQDFKLVLENLFSLQFDYVPNIVSDLFVSANDVKSDIFTFANVGFLDKNKNQAMLIKSFARSFKGQDKIRLLVVGDGCEYNNLKNLVDDLGVSKQVILYGNASRAEVVKLLQNSNVFVLASKYETFGVAVIEALAVGLPVISTKCGGPESIIVNNSLGLLVENTELNLSLAMENMFKNYKNYEKKFIINYVQNNFSSTAVIQKIVSIYNKVLGSQN
jgi:glycosyltransferase involved in cell wall biosynthesis